VKRGKKKKIESNQGSFSFEGVSFTNSTVTKAVCDILQCREKRKELLKRGGKIKRPG